MLPLLAEDWSRNAEDVPGLGCDAAAAAAAAAADPAAADGAGRLNGGGVLLAILLRISTSPEGLVAICELVVWLSTISKSGK